MCDRHNIFKMENLGYGEKSSQIVYLYEDTDEAGLDISTYKLFDNYKCVF